jgi:hypothetical protein
VETGNGLISELAETIAKRDANAFVKATLTRAGDGWRVRYLEAVVGQRPPGWEVEAWDYQGVAFVACELTGASLAEVLRGSPRTFGERPVQVPAPQLQSYWTERPSLFRLDTRRLPWPTVEWTLHEAQTDNAAGASWHPTGMLVSDAAPTFALFQVAHRAFYSGDFSNFGASQAPSDLGRIWLVRDEAWLHRVRVAPTQRQIDVAVRGPRVSATRLDVVGAFGAVGKSVGRTGRVRLRLPDEIAGDAWLYLVDGNRCLDYRALGNRFHVQDDLARQGVEFEVPDDPESEISSVVGRIESPRLEYKVKLPDSDKEVHGVVKSVAAFATGDGGDIVFGVDKDEITIVGLHVDDLVKQRDRLYQLVRDRVTPAPAVTIESFDWDGKGLMVLSVEPGIEPPYGLSGQTTRYYVRRGTHTVPARPDEIRHSILSRQPPADPRS